VVARWIGEPQDVERYLQTNWFVDKHGQIIKTEKIITKPLTVVGKCCRCGKEFTNREDWERHERSIPLSHGKCPYGKGAHKGSLEYQELRCYWEEPEYVKRFRNSPGSPVGSNDKKRFNRDSYSFIKERKALTGS